MPNRLALPPLYVILDAALLPSDPLQLASKLLDAGVRLFQYRNKTAPALEILQTSQSLSVGLLQRDATFIVNDRADIAKLAGASGTHLGQCDLAVDAARRIIGRGGIIGISTHDLQQLRRAIDSDADYIAVGPVFATPSKRNPDPVVGLELVRQARRLTQKPIVAIGGITLERARSVVDAGADCVAVISDILAAKDPTARAAQFLEILPAAAPPAQN